MKSKKRIVLYIALLLMAVYLMTLLFNLRKDAETILPKDYAQIKASGELNVATDYNSIGYFISGDSVAGFQYELIKALERNWNLKVNLFLENSLDETLQGLASGKYDVVARNIPVNSRLRQEFDFTKPITLNKQVLVQRKAEYNDSVAPIRQQLALAGKTVWVPKDSPIILRLQNLSQEIGDTIFVKENDVYETEQLTMMVAGGDIDFTVCDEFVAKQLAQRFPEIDVETAVGFTQLESWAVRRDSPVLLDSLNAWLSRFRASKDFNRLYKKYY